MKRYAQILSVIDEVKPQIIFEVGTWNGKRAIDMVERALMHTLSVHYVGFDLFQESTYETDQREFNVKKTLHTQEIDRSFNRFQSKVGGKRFTYELVKGDTRETMKAWDGSIADLVWLDGGHSIETIDNDYRALHRSKEILFDDYYTPDESGDCPDIEKYGCNKIVCELPHKILPVIDRIPGLGQIQIVRRIRQS